VESKKIDYKSANKLPTLEVPPDLTAPTGDNRYAIPDAQGSGTATLSTYSQERKAAPSARKPCCPRRTRHASSAPAPSAGWWCRRRRSRCGGDQDFWQETVSSSTGITGNRRDRNRLGGEPRQHSAGCDSPYAGQVHDACIHSRARQVPHPHRSRQGRHEIYISHRGMMEVYATEGQDKTVWQPRRPTPNSRPRCCAPDAAFRGEENRAQTLLAKQQTPETGAYRPRSRGPGAGNGREFRPRLAPRRPGAGSCRLCGGRPRPFQGRVFLSLHRSRCHNASKRDDGILAKFAFWRSKKAQTSPQLQIVVSEAGDKSRVNVSGVDGKPVDANTQNRIINLLHKELK